MDAIVMLKDDHKQVEQLFKKLEKDDLSVVPRICEALTLHAQLEEMLFYPEVRTEVEDVADDVDEAVEEHHVVKILISELQAMSETDDAVQGQGHRPHGARPPPRGGGGGRDVPGGARRAGSQATAGDRGRDGRPQGAGDSSLISARREGGRAVSAALPACAGSR